MRSRVREEQEVDPSEEEVEPIMVDGAMDAMEAGKASGRRPVREAGEEDVPEALRGPTQRGGEPSTKTRSRISRGEPETDTNHMMSTCRPEGPWSGTMTTISIKKEEDRPSKKSTSSHLVVEFFFSFIS
jgi:hypothetical protein